MKEGHFTDIIIPTYNNDDITAKCFSTIKEHTKEGTYRIIWVDNGSEDMSLSREDIKGVNCICVFLRENRGFVGAVNEGLRISNAPAVCLLNNDTEVSPRWLEKLTNRLYADPNLGILGPLTGPPAIEKRYDSHHNIAYQQAYRKVPIFPEYKDLADFNLKIEAELPGVIGDVDFVAFLCALIKREVIDKVGLLDTNYDMGMWDDCDWNRGAKKVGYTVALLLDTCIIHKGRSTFNLIHEKEGFDVNALLQKNREYMKKKWGY